MGTDAYSGGIGTSINIAEANNAPVTPAPAGGALQPYSPTHSDPNSWYANKDVQIVWNRPDGAYGFSFIFDQSPDTIPDDILDTTITQQKIYPNVADGAWYFHIKSRGKTPGSAFSDVATFKVQIDSTPPENFAIKVPDGIDPNNLTAGDLAIYFEAHDATSGIDHYDALVDGKILGKSITSPYEVALHSGEHVIGVIAYDKAGNSTKAELPVKVKESRLAAFLKQFSFITYLLVFLNLLILILILLIILLIARQRRHEREHALPGDVAQQIAAIQASVDRNLVKLRKDIDKRLTKIIASSGVGENLKEDLDKEIDEAKASLDKKISKSRKR